MSIIEKSLIDGFSSIRIFFNTFFALIFAPATVLRSMSNDYHSSIKYLNPAIFFVISIFLSFILKVESHSNSLWVTEIEGFAKMLPSFIHDTTFIDIIVYTSPIIIATYVAIGLIAIVIRMPQDYKRIFRNFAFYSLAMAQLLFFCGLLIGFIIDKVKPVRVNDHHLFGPFEILEMLLFLLTYALAIGLPLIAIFRVLLQNDKILLFLRFLIIPALIIPFYGFIDKVNDVTASYRDQSHLKQEIKYSFPFAFPDRDHFPIKFKKHTDSVTLVISMLFNNPTNQVYFLPEYFDFSYRSKDLPNVQQDISFSSVENVDSIWENSRNYLMLKPAEVKQIKYGMVIPRNKFEALVKCEKDTAQNNFCLNMSYYDFEGASQYISRNWKFTFYEDLPADSTRKLTLLLLGELKKIFKDTDNTQPNHN